MDFNGCTCKTNRLKHLLFKNSNLTILSNEFQWINVPNIYQLWYLLIFNKTNFSIKIEKCILSQIWKIMWNFWSIYTYLDKMLRIFSKTCPLKMTITERKNCQAQFVNPITFPLFFLSYKEIIVQSWNFLHFASQSTSEKNEHIILQEEL